MSASHITLARNDLFIGNCEACIVNRKKKEKSMLRKEDNEYVLDLFVKVPSGAAAPIRHTPMEVDAINQAADGRGQRKQVPCLIAVNHFLMAGGVSVGDRSK